MAQKSKFKADPKIAQEHVKAALETLRKGVEGLSTVDGFTRHLTGISRGNIARYSVNNQVLILMQCPEATVVGGYHFWVGKGRKPIAGRGLRILAPTSFTVKTETEDEETGETTEELRTIRRFKTVVIWDVTGTEGPALPVAPDLSALPFSNGPVADVEAAQLDADLCAALLAKWGCPVAEENLGRAYGCFYTRENRIAVDRRHDPVTNCATVAHEGGHCVLHNDPALAGGGYDVEEQIVEGAAYVALAHRGLKTDRFSFRYIAQYGGNVKSIVALADRIGKVAHLLIVAAGDEQPEEEAAA